MDTAGHSAGHGSNQPGTKINRERLTQAGWPPGQHAGWVTYRTASETPLTSQHVLKAAK